MLGLECSRRLKMVLVYVTLGGLAGVVGIPYSLVVGNVDRLYRVSMWIVRAGVRAAGIRVEVSGLENVPAGVSCIFLSNHVSNLDPPVLFPVLPGKSSVLLKQGADADSAAGDGDADGRVCAGGARQPARVRRRPAWPRLRRRCRSGLHMLIFAEGTRSRGWAAGGVQARAVLSGDGDGRADCADGDLRHADDDAQGQRGDPAGSGAGADAPADLSRAASPRAMS